MPSTTHPDTDSGADLEQRCRLLDEWVARRREIDALEAEAARLLVERIGIHDADVDESPFHRDSIYRSMVAEYSAAGHIPKGSIEFAFTDARTLFATLPAVREAFAAGLISVRHVREIVRASEIVDDAVRDGRVEASTMALYETAVLVVAEKDTAARTKTHARLVAAALVGETVVEQGRRAEGERSVSVRPAGDGLAVLTAVLPEWVAAAIMDRLTQMARLIARARREGAPESRPASDLSDASREEVPYDAGESPDAEALPAEDTAHSEEGSAVVDTRTLDQVRADLFADLLLASDPSTANGSGIDNVHARIQVTVAASTLASEDERPAELDGHGPLDPEVARGLAGRSSGWSRLFLDASGLVTETDTYTPTEMMRRFLRARDQHCRFPGCRMPVHRCEIDHNHDHARGGKTRVDNLSHFCTTHHSLKHPDVDESHRWTARQLPDGSVTWTSPLRRTYTDPPRRRVMFV